MNIALFTDTYYPEINGVANSVYQLKKGLEQLGHNVYVFTTTNAMHCKEENEYRIFSVPFIFMKDRRMSFPIYLKWLRIIKKLNIDVVHTHTEFSLGILGRRIAKKLNIKHVHTYHTIYEDYIHYLKLPKNKYTVKFVQDATKYFCNKANVVVAPTEKTREILVNYGVTSEISIIPTGINFLKFENIDFNRVTYLKNQLGYSDEDIIFVSIGRISAEKGLEETITNFSKLSTKNKNIKLLIVGDGPYKKTLEKMVLDKRLEKSVTFTGYVNWEDIQNYYAIGDIFVSSSTSETQGLTYLEALVTGLYLLVRKDKSLEGLIDNGINGFEFENFDQFEVSYYLLKEKLNAKKRATINNKYTQEGYALSVEKIYKELIC